MGSCILRFRIPGFLNSLVSRSCIPGFLHPRVPVSLGSCIPGLLYPSVFVSIMIGFLFSWVRVSLGSSILRDLVLLDFDILVFISCIPGSLYIWLSVSLGSCIHGFWHTVSLRFLYAWVAVFMAGFLYPWVSASLDYPWVPVSCISGFLYPWVPVSLGSCTLDSCIIHDTEISGGWIPIFATQTVQGSYLFPRVYILYQSVQTYLIN